MTIEEKAQCYDEALKVIKECNPDGNGFITIYPQEIFPELKESEDEKVEKAIFGLVYDSDNELWSSYDVSKSDVLAWLESLKDRVQPKPKQEWSEEDKEKLQNLIHNIEYCEKIDKSDTILWLKSIYAKYHWKPSDEQIDILDMVLTNESMDDNIARILRELREQLKKLKA